MSSNPFSIRLLFSILLLLNFASLSAQELDPKEGEKYRVWLKSVDGSPTQAGKIIDVFEDGLLFVPGKSPRALEWPADNIRRLYFRRHNSIGRGMLYGGLIGAGAGALLGVALSQPAPNCDLFCESPGELSLTLGVIFGLPGAAIGLLAGSYRDLLKINGDRLEFELNRGLLLRYKF